MIAEEPISPGIFTWFKKMVENNQVQDIVEIFKLITDDKGFYQAFHVAVNNDLTALHDDKDMEYIDGQSRVERKSSIRLHGDLSKQYGSGRLN